MIKKFIEIINPLIPDRTYLKLKYRYHLDQKLNLSNPQTFNEKIQWLKLYDRKPEYNKYVDKYAVREHIKRTIGEEYLIPLIGVYDNVDDIDWSKLPNKFVLKCTHGSQCNIICTDKSKLDIDESKRKLNVWMNRNWYWYGREWPYKNVKPRIVCEKFMVDESGFELKDYKIFCFNSRPRIIQVNFNHTSSSFNKNFYDEQWNFLPFSLKQKSDANARIGRPEKLENMFKLAEYLSKQMPFARVDFYSINRKIYFGEITFYPVSGFGKFSSREFDLMLGSWLSLS